MKLILTFLIFSALCYAQLPEAPQPVCQNGKPWLTGLEAKLVGQCPLDKVEDDRISPPTDTGKFFSLRGVYRDAEGRKQFNWNAPMLKFGKRDWTLWGVSNGLLWVSWATSNHQVEHAGSEVPAILAMNGLTLLAGKTLARPAVLVSGLMAEHYFRARR